MKDTKSDKVSDRITEYVSADAVPENIPKTEIAKQPEFYKIPRRFGSIPVDQLPLGCSKEEQYYNVYPRVALPFQKAQRITFGHSELDPNRLFWGDNLHVMRMLPSNSMDLIYIDPPFFSGRNYNMIFGDQNEIRSFTDIWEGGMPGYLVWLNARLLEMKRLLKSTGSLYIHLDWHAVHYVKTEMDKIFGYDNFRNEIIWKRTTAHGDTKQGAKRFSMVHDTILLYSKSSDFVWNPQYVPFDEDQIKQQYNKKDGNGRLYRLVTPTAAKGGGDTEYEFHGVKPPRGRYWAYSRSKMEKMYKDDLLYFSNTGQPYIKYYLDERPGVITSSLWTDIKQIAPTSSERIGYPTQKAESLLDRIIRTSSNENHVVADFFCGGGTTPAVAQKLGRKWIACDQSRVAVAITQSRLEGIYEEGKSIQTRLTSVPDISVEYWGTYEIPTLTELSNEEFKSFIISAFGGRLSSAGEYIHGYKKDIPLFVGPSTQEDQVTKEDVINFAQEITTKKGRSQGTMLAWAFSPSARSAVQKLLAEGDPSVELIKISAIEIESSEFRAHVTKLHDEYNSLLTFILPPEVRFSSKRLKPLHYVFDVSESIALNNGSEIINVQWDFNFEGRFTPTKGFAFGRDNQGKPLYKVNYSFDTIGNRTIACRVQDDVGGEKIYLHSLSVH